MSEFCMALITTPSLEEAETLAAGLVEARLAACVNIVPQVRSVYRWQGAVQKESEALMVCKTMVTHWETLREWVSQHHSYDVPEIIQIPINAGASSYLDWIRECLQK